MPDILALDVIIIYYFTAGRKTMIGSEKRKKTERCGGVIERPEAEP